MTDSIAASSAQTHSTPGAICRSVFGSGANSDRAAFQPGNVGQAKLGVYSLTSGERIAMVDLAAVIGTPNDPPQYFANDLTVDGGGTVYVTDTMNNVVFKVTPDYQASVLHRFTGLPQGVAVNGIVYHDGGYLLVVANEHIYKVPVASPDATSEVKVSEPVPGQDGAVWAADGHLAIFSLCLYRRTGTRDGRLRRRA